MRKQLEEKEKELMQTQKYQEEKKQKREAYKQKLSQIQRSVAEANECARILGRNFVFSS